MWKCKPTGSEYDMFRGEAIIDAAPSIVEDMISEAENIKLLDPSWYDYLPACATHFQRCSWISFRPFAPLTSSTANQLTLSMQVFLLRVGVNFWILHIGSILLTNRFHSHPAGIR